MQAAAAAQRDATDRRGQDVTLRGQDMTAATARTAARLDQMNKDRTFALEQDKVAFDQDQKSRDALNRADKAANERIQSWIPNGPDGKPDTATAARYTQALNSHIAGQIRNLEAEVQANPSNTRAALALRQLRTQGADAMPIDEQRKMIEGIRAREVAVANDSLIGNTALGRATGIGARGAQSDRPITSLRKVSGPLGDYYTDGTDDVRIPANAVDYVPGTGFLGFGRQRNNNFDTLRQK